MMAKVSTIVDDGGDETHIAATPPPRVAIFVVIHITADIIRHTRVQTFSGRHIGPRPFVARAWRCGLLQSFVKGRIRHDEVEFWILCQFLSIICAGLMILQTDRTECGMFGRLHGSEQRAAAYVLRGRGRIRIISHLYHMNSILEAVGPDVDTCRFDSERVNVRG
jgi:hypothetical protein